MIYVSVLNKDYIHRSEEPNFVNDELFLPEGTWEAEKNYTLTHPDDRTNVDDHHIGINLSPPSIACITIQPVYDRNWVQSAGGDGAGLVWATIKETEKIFQDKYTASNQLGTSFTFDILGKY